MCKIQSMYMRSQGLMPCRLRPVLPGGRLDTLPCAARWRARYLPKMPMRHRCMLHTLLMLVLLPGNPCTWQLTAGAAVQACPLPQHPCCMPAANTAPILSGRLSGITCVHTNVHGCCCMHASVCGGTWVGTSTQSGHVCSSLCSAVI
jgi:hypothetical protein